MRIGFKNLVEVSGDAVVGHAAVAEDGVEGLLLGDGGDGFGGDAGVEAGQQEAVGDVEHLLAADDRLGDGAGQLHAQVEHYLEQQVFRCAVGLDVVRSDGQQILRHGGGVIVHVLHVGGIQTEDAETDVQTLSSQTSLVLDLAPGATDALFADFADVEIARLVGFAGFVCFFRQLYHDELAVPAVFGVELHNSVGRGGRAGKEIKNH